MTFIFVNPDGSPSDINGDNYLDSALNEVYYNNTFGQAGTDRVGNPWGINVSLPGIDVETVALHENGHSLGLGHFGPPPTAVMNPVYSGIQHAPVLWITPGCAQSGAGGPGKAFFLSLSRRPSGRLFFLRKKNAPGWAR